MTSATRRSLLKGAAALAAAPYVITARSQETLIVNTQGGEYQELVERVVIRPFEKKFGVKVIHDADRHRLAGLRQDPRLARRAGFDVAGLLTPPEVILGVKEGLLEKLTEREVPNLRHLWDKTWQVIPPGAARRTRCNTRRSSTTRKSSSGRARGRITGSRRRSTATR